MDRERPHTTAKCQPSFNPLTWHRVGILPKMSPVTDREDKLLNLVPGFPITHTTPPGLDQGRSRSEHSSYSGSPMSIGSPVGTASLAPALKMRTCPVTPVISSSRREPPAHDDEEEMDATEDDAKKDEGWRRTRLIHSASAPCLVHHQVKLEDQMGLSVKRPVCLLGTLLYSIVTFYLASNHFIVM